MTQHEAISLAVDIAATVTGLSADQVLFSPMFDGYLDMVCQRYNVQDEPEPEPEFEPAYWIQMEQESLRRGEG